MREISGRRYGVTSDFWRQIPSGFFFFVEEREREFFAQILNLFFSKHTYMASTNDIARLLNVDHRDSSAFADVIAEYFDDREADVYSSSDSEDGSGM